VVYCYLSTGVGWLINDDVMMYLDGGDRSNAIGVCHAAGECWVVRVLSFTIGFLVSGWEGGG